MPAVGQTGGLLLVETVRATGLDRVSSAQPARWRKPFAVHDPGKIICDLAIGLALGGECMAD
ncbi:MAG: IS1380 family transposase, partial [Propionibacterium sp.]|nr:IS1380 family transposase [Propionibacterium sp.]